MKYFRSQKGSVINEKEVIKFSFDGKIYLGYSGDTLSSALLANGVHLMGRSFKYHRPRGILSSGSEEPNAIVTFDRGEGKITPNVRATTLEIFEGLQVFSQNSYPNLKFDIGAFNNIFSMFFPAGFYNKTFMWPKSFWDKVYEPFIRNLAGLGPAPINEDPDNYASSYGHCETLIIGSGPAGIAAALTASQKEGRVILVDEQSEIGGSLLSSSNKKIDNMNADQWLSEVRSKLEKSNNVKIMTRTTAIGYWHDNFVALSERLTDHMSEVPQGRAREQLHRIRAKRVILAQGAIERPLVFNGNDKPGVMLSNAAQTYLNKYGVRVGDNISIFTSHDSAYETAFEMCDAKVSVSVIIDLRKEIDADLLAKAQSRGIVVHLNSSISKTYGKLRINSFEVFEPKLNKKFKVKCDALIMSGGWTPSLHLWSHSKGTIKWNKDLSAYIPDKAHENVCCIGACNGNFGIAKALNEGNSVFENSKKYIVKEQSFGTGIVPSNVPSYISKEKQKAFVDFQNDVTEKDISLAVQEGFKSIEHIKRYTTNGMATDQGKTSNLNALEIASREVGSSIEKVGLTTFRPPYTPTTFGTFVGYRDKELFDPVRKTPIDAWAESNGAIYEPVGLWRRARFFPKDDENMEQAVARECKSTRDSLGIFDASTLGKIEVVGPDATKFMNLMYCTSWTSLKVGNCRYGLMLGEDGYIYDDGVVARIAEDRYHVTTTTGGAPRVFRHMEDYLQTEFNDLNVWLTSTTEQWAVIALNGPHARDILEPLVEGIDLSADFFPHMSLRLGSICGIPTRLFRVSFTGELGFEINVPSHYGLALWKILMAEGSKYKITPYGTEAMHVLRAEKGFIIVGQDTDGTVTPHDAGMAWAVAKKKKDFVGMRSLNRKDLVSGMRKQLVGLLTKNPLTVLAEGSQVVLDPKQPKPMKMIGHVTSSYWSESLGKSVAMAVIEDGFNLMGEDVYIPMPSGTIQAKVCKSVFYDPEGKRIHV